MTAIRKYRPGQFCWTDLDTTDVAGAKKFYRGLFGWEAKDFPMGPGDEKYSILRVDGKDACALYPMDAGARAMKATPTWLPYIAVKSVARSATKAKAAGGKICLGPLDVMDNGRMAIVQDPTGAGFALWQAGKHSGAKLKGVPGTVMWHDLNTPNVKASAKFYTKVFGWKVETRDFSGNKYHLLTAEGEGFGGIWPQPTEQLPPGWVTYWLVAKCAKTLAKAKKLGGSVLMDTITVPHTCRFAVLADPQGAAFAILEPLVD
jgi:predicted enzyme related to lactoylglutathione lyase